MFESLGVGGDKLWPARGVGRSAWLAASNRYRSAGSTAAEPLVSHV